MIAWPLLTTVLRSGKALAYAAAVAAVAATYAATYAAGRRASEAEHAQAALAAREQAVRTYAAIAARQDAVVTRHTAAERERHAEFADLRRRLAAHGPGRRLGDCLDPTELHHINAARGQRLPPAPRGPDAAPADSLASP